MPFNVLTTNESKKTDFLKKNSFCSPMAWSGYLPSKYVHLFWIHHLQNWPLRRQLGLISNK